MGRDKSAPLRTMNVFTPSPECDNLYVSMNVLTGIQPTNALHIGNLFGALIPAKQLQQDHDLTMMIVDGHAITVPQDPKQLTENIYLTAAAYLAAGIDPKQTLFFQQTAVPQHAELAWILQTLAKTGELERMTQYKDKSDHGKKPTSVGLFTYPVLMAADILLYDIETVPVGDDQKQHVELTRDLAERFNKKYGEVFTIPNPQINTNGARIRSLVDPEKKMSKSDPSEKSRISILDDETTIKKKIMSAVTDSEPGITVDDARAGLHNLLTIYSMVTGETMVTIAERYNSAKDLKEDLAEALLMYLMPLQAEIHSWMKNKQDIREILSIGAEGAEEIARKKLDQVKRKVGLLL